MWPEKSTAFMVFHGSGPHRPFETLDSFARGFWNVLQKENKGEHIQWKHRLYRHDKWIESYVSLTAEGRPTLDIHEFYWDIYMIREIEMKELIDWLSRASKGAKKFYANFPDLAKEYERLGVDLFKDGEFRSAGYLILFGWIGNLLRLLPLLSLHWIGSVLKPIIELGSSYVLRIAQDAVIYSTADVRSRNYEIRQNMLRGAVEALQSLLHRQDYDNIVVVGHSLGSAIAYDTFNRIAREMCCEPDGIPVRQNSKIVGFITFGSPLDKIAFFFQERIPEENFVQAQILHQMHGFKRFWPEGNPKHPIIENPFLLEPETHVLDGMKWFNFYHPKDKVGGSLDVYKVDDNVKCCMYAKGHSEAHDCYWNYDEMYRRIAYEFFQ